MLPALFVDSLGPSEVIAFVAREDDRASSCEGGPMPDYRPTWRRPIAETFRRTAHLPVRWCVRRGVHPNVVSCSSIRFTTMRSERGLMFIMPFNLQLGLILQFVWPTLD